MPNKPIISVDPSAGFCFGVEKAIQLAEDHLKAGEKVYGLGHMVHNEEEIARLDELGLQTIWHEDLKNVKSGKVLLRAHGEPPSTYDMAGKLELDLIDATCPIVKTLQAKIRKRYDSLDSAKEIIVIFGKKNHPETIGLMGQTNNTAYLLNSPGEAATLPKDRKVYLYSQTTMDPDEYDQIETFLREQVGEKTELLHSNCSICGQMKRRKPGLKDFALKNDVIVFISGKDSSNGEMLFRYTRSVNSASYRINNPGDIDPGWFGKAKRIGITGATSTPVWQLERAKKHVESLINQND